MVTVSPAWTLAPESGIWLTTVVPAEPGMTWTRTTSPSAWSVRLAASVLLPTTLGMGNSRGPRETQIVTLEPRAAVPPEGSSRITFPRGTVVEYALWASTVNPAAIRDCSASPAGCPATWGTRTGCGPLLTVIRTLLPYGMVWPGSGFWAMTRPAFTASL